MFWMIIPILAIGAATGGIIAMEAEEEERRRRDREAREARRRLREQEQARQEELRRQALRNYQAQLDVQETIVVEADRRGREYISRNREEIVQLQQRRLLVRSQRWWAIGSRRSAFTSELGKLDALEATLNRCVSASQARIDELQTERRRIRCEREQLQLLQPSQMLLTDSDPHGAMGGFHLRSI